jgi:hypothetical protein
MTKKGENTAMVTMVRGEIIGGVRLAGRVGEAEAAHAVDRCLKRVERVVDGFRGQLLASGAGQLSAAFQTPEEACLAAIDMQRRVADLPPASGVKLTIRLGVHGAEDEAAARGIAAQLLELALPDQILCSREVLLQVAYGVGIRVRDLNQLEMSGGEAFQVMELLWHEPKNDEEGMPDALTSTSLLALEGIDRHGHGDFSRPGAEVGTPRLCLRYRGKSFLLDDRTPGLSMGRERHNDVVIEDGKASRQHARIEQRDGRYFLCDQSTNGTFVTFAGEPEVFLRNESLPLRGSGILSFGVSAKDPDAQKAEFEYL